MMHKNRAHVRVEVLSAEELATKLTQNSWTTCSGFKYRDYLYLNDSTSEDGVQEYAVFHATPEANGEYKQVESITFGWMTHEEALAAIQKIATGQLLGGAYSQHKLAQHPKGSCARCA